MPTPTPTPSFPAYTGPPLQRDQMGIQVHIHREDLDAIFAHIDELGVGWVKVQVSWKLYQPQPDGYAEDRLAELDRFVALAQAQNLQVLLSVAKAPEWSRSTTELDGPPQDFGRYRQFMRFLAARYRGQVAAYELWNEPNLQREWNGFTLSGAAFVHLLAEGAAGVRAGDPEAVLISGAPATTGINDRETAIDDRVFLREMVAAGVTELVDAVGVHPYGWANPHDSSISAPAPGVPSHNDHPSFFFGDTLADYTAVLDEFGAAETSLWVTEFGWGSFEQIGAPPAGADFMAYVSEWQQAEYGLRAFQLAQANPRIGPLFLWNLNFGPLLGTDFSESGYSVLRPDGSKRPFYLSLANAPKR